MSTGFGPSPEPRQPGYDAAAYQPGYHPAAYQPGYSQAAYEPGTATGTNTPGRVSLAAGILVVLIGVVQQVVGYSLPALMDIGSLSPYPTYRMFSMVMGGASLVVGLVAVIAGAVGLKAPGKPKGAAGAGCALGAWAVLSSLLGLVLPAILLGLPR